MSSYLNFYEMSSIPCSSESAHEIVSTGLAAVNIDGRHIQGGIKANGVCMSGGYSTEKYGLFSPTGNWPSSGSMFFANNLSYAIGGVGVASSNNAVKLSRLSFGL